MNAQGRFDSRSTAQELVAHLAAAAREIAVADVRIGLGHPAVKLADGRTGMAYTFRDQAQGGCPVFDGIRPLYGRPAAGLLALIESPDPIEAGVGPSCGNALANRLEPARLGGEINVGSRSSPRHRSSTTRSMGCWRRPVHADRLRSSELRRRSRPRHLGRPERPCSRASSSLRPRRFYASFARAAACGNSARTSAGSP